MISEPLRNNQYIASNSNESQFSGAETQLDWRVTQADRLRLTYAYVDAQASNPLDEQLTARNSGSAGWLRDWGLLLRRRRPQWLSLRTGRYPSRPAHPPGQGQPGTGRHPATAPR
jgi:hypothetical protein